MLKLKNTTRGQVKTPHEHITINNNEQSPKHYYMGVSYYQYDNQSPTHKVNSNSLRKNKNNTGEYIHERICRSKRKQKQISRDINANNHNISIQSEHEHKNNQIKLITYDQQNLKVREEIAQICSNQNKAQKDNQQELRNKGQRCHSNMKKQELNNKQIYRNQQGKWQAPFVRRKKVKNIHHKSCSFRKFTMENSQQSEHDKFLNNQSIQKIAHNIQQDQYVQKLTNGDKKKKKQSNKKSKLVFADMGIIKKLKIIDRHITETNKIQSKSDKKNQQCTRQNVFFQQKTNKIVSLDQQNCYSFKEKKFNSDNTQKSKPQKNNGFTTFSAENEDIQKKWIQIIKKETQRVYEAQTQSLFNTLPSNIILSPNSINSIKANEIERDNFRWHTCQINRKNINPKYQNKFKQKQNILKHNSKFYFFPTNYKRKSVQKTDPENNQSQTNMPQRLHSAPLKLKSKEKEDSRQSNGQNSKRLGVSKQKIFKRNPTFNDRIIEEDIINKHCNAGYKNIRNSPSKKIKDRNKSSAYFNFDGTLSNKKILPLEIEPYRSQTTYPCKFKIDDDKSILRKRSSILDYQQIAKRSQSAKNTKDRLQINNCMKINPWDVENGGIQNGSQMLQIVSSTIYDEFPVGL